MHLSDPIDTAVDDDTFACRLGAVLDSALRADLEQVHPLTPALLRRAAREG